mmetsp:Transcript_29886/g.114740  ORF Transcript_29886/g.114740 Transcript_29886/m.114740 type:complete len:132 (-) Transcript_29886:1918-2313(-)
MPYLPRSGFSIPFFDIARQSPRTLRESSIEITPSSQRRELASVGSGKRVRVQAYSDYEQKKYPQFGEAQEGQGNRRPKPNCYYTWKFERRPRSENMKLYNIEQEKNLHSGDPCRSKVSRISFRLRSTASSS